MDEELKAQLHNFFSENGKKGGKIGGATTKRKYGYEHYRKLGLHMNEVKKAKKEILPSDTELSYDVARKLFKEQHWRMSEILTPLEHKVLARRFGLNGAEYNQEEIGREFDISGQRIHQIENDALKKVLRHDNPGK